MSSNQNPRTNPRGGDRRGPRQFSGRPGLSWAYALGLLLLLGLAQMYYFVPAGKSITYSEFKEYVKNDAVSEVVVGEQNVRGTLKQAVPNGNRQTKEFTATRVEDPKLTEELEARGIKYSGESNNRWLPELLGWLVPLLFFVGIWGFFFRRMSGAEGGVIDPRGQVELVGLGEAAYGVHMGDEALDGSAAIDAGGGGVADQVGLGAGAVVVGAGDCALHEVEVAAHCSTVAAVQAMRV